MKIAVIIIRVLMGLLFLFASLTFFLNLIPTPELTGSTKTFMEGLTAVGYLLPLVKAVELLCAIAFITGQYVPLAVVTIAPIIVNIFLFHTFIDQAGFAVGLFLILANGFLAYAYWNKFQPILEAK
jgi:putative oxidoreductase